MKPVNLRHVDNGTVHRGPEVHNLPPSPAAVGDSGIPTAATGGGETGHTVECGAQHAGRAPSAERDTVAAKEKLTARGAQAFCGFVPYDGHLLVKRVDGPGEWTLPEGFAVPDAYKKKSQWAVTLGVGAGVEEVKVGDVLLLRVWGGTELTIAGEPLIVIRDEHILAVLDG